MPENISYEEIEQQAMGELSSATTSQHLDQVRIKYLGKKGKLSALLKQLGTLPADQRKEFGQKVNALKNRFNKDLDQRAIEIQQAEEDSLLEKEWIDVTLPYMGPSLQSQVGHIHPLSQIQSRLEDIFLGLGFSVADGPEVESEHFNFEALNIPDHHPARDMQDTIWTGIPGLLLRTQTSAIQVRTLLNQSPPLRIVAPGRCFRYERLDATHEHTFYQMEGMMIDKEVSVGNLIYFMKTLLKEIYGFEAEIRLRPGYFPFVEPGFELDIKFNDTWLELLPCGLVHPRVLEAGGLDPQEWQGFAFGLGLSRLVMTQYQITDIRHMLSGDLRFTEQF